MTDAPRLSVAELAQQLIRFDTTNPPGREFACVNYIRELAEAAGLQTTVRALDPERPNLIVRLPGRGAASPLLLHGHVDVVPVAQPRRWREDPFGGAIVDGELWGRGALDMKGGLAMMLTALLRLRESPTPPPGDVVLAVVSDEEGGSEFGARFLVAKHPELFAGIRYAIGEFGGIARPDNGGNVYLVPVAEKQWCTLRLRLSGTGGHASVPSRGGPLRGLADILAAVGSTRLPIHLPAVSAAMIDAYADALPAERGDTIRQLKTPDRAAAVLDDAHGALAVFDAALHNSVNVTVVRAGDRIDALPDLVEIQLDARVLPEQRPEDLIDELKAICPADVDIELRHVDEPPTARVDTGLIPDLTEALRGPDPGATVVPSLNPGVTDGRFFARLGIAHHGFLPLRLPDPALIQTMHGTNERVPVAALEFGTHVYERLLRNRTG